MVTTGKKTVIIGGDFNASVGEGKERAGVHGKWGIGRMNEAGRDLMDWCEAQGLTYVNSYMPHANRGTWYHVSRGEWYELDGFLMTNEERHKRVKKMKATYRITEQR